MNLLLKHGADINNTNNTWDTPLHVAIKHGHEEFSLALITKLTQQGLGMSKVDIENLTEKMTPYFLAVLQG